MDNRIQRHLDEIIKTPIPSDVFAKELELELRYARRKARECDKEYAFLLAEAYAATAQQCVNSTATIAKITQTAPFTIERIFNGNIPPALDYLERRNAALIGSLIRTIELAAIAAYLDQNRKTVEELIPILLPEEEDNASSNWIDREKEDRLKWELRNVVQETDVDEKIRAWLRSTIDAGEESPPMSSGDSRKE